MWVHPLQSFVPLSISHSVYPRLAYPFLLSSPLRRSISPPPAACPRTRYASRTHFFYSTYAYDPYLCTILTIFRLDQSSPTTAAPPTPIGDDTHNTLLTVHYDEDYTHYIHACITGLEAGAYAYGCCIPPSLSPPPELIEPSIPGATALPTLGGLDDDEPVQEHIHVAPNSLTLNLHDLTSPQPAMSTMTFAFHPFHDPYNFTNTHSLPQNPPSITAPTSLHDPAFPANYDSWGLAPTLSPAQYGPPAGLHHGDETHGQPLDVHLTDASSLLFGSYAPPPENEQLSPSTILRHDTYESVLGNVFSSVAPTGLAPQAPISLPTLDFPCLAPPPSHSVQTQIDPLAPASQSALSDPTSPPGRPACSKRVSKRKRKRSVSREEDPDPHITSQLQAANHGPQTSSTATPKSPKAMRGFVGRGGSSSRMAPPPVPSLQPAGHHQRSSPTSSSGTHQQQQHHQQQQPQPGYPTVPVGSMDERYPKRRRVDDGQSPSGLSVAQQQQQIAGYPAQQYQSPAQAHWYGSGAQPTNAPIPQPPQPPYGYSSTSAGPSYSQHAHPAHAPTRNPSMYAAPISNAPSQWTSTPGQEQYYYSGATAYSQPTQAYQQPPYTSPTHAGTYQVHTPAGSSSSGSGSIARPTPPMAPGPIPPSATVPLVTRPLSSSAGSKGVAAGSSAAVSAVGSQVPHRGGSGGNPMGTGHPAPVMMDSVIDVSGEDRFEHGPSEFPPKPYPGGEKAKSPWWPTRKTEKLYGSRLDQMPALENRVARLEEGIDRLLDHRAEQALKNSQLPGMDFEHPPIVAPERSPTRLFSGKIWPSALTRRVKREKPGSQGPQR